MTAPSLRLPNRRATRLLGRAIATVLKPSDLYVLEGPLGSGKTFLVRAICRGLGVPRDVRITSPTFTLVHEYAARLPVCHADLYRLTSPSEVLALGLLERRDEGAVLLVEWGAPHAGLLGKDAVTIEISVDPREATLRATGPESSRRVSEIVGAFSPLSGQRSKTEP